MLRKLSSILDNPVLFSVFVLICQRNATVPKTIGCHRFTPIFCFCHLYYHLLKLPLHFLFELSVLYLVLLEEDC
jgi:hypothetical protein